MRLLAVVGAHHPPERSAEQARHVRPLAHRGPHTPVRLWDKHALQQKCDRGYIAGDEQVSRSENEKAAHPHGPAAWPRNTLRREGLRSRHSRAESGAGDARAAEKAQGEEAPQVGGLRPGSRVDRSLPIHAYRLAFPDPSHFSLADFLRSRKVLITQGAVRLCGRRRRHGGGAQRALCA